ncbi:MAG TPA: type II secretion system protein [Mycobacteriales bacterium]|nr:type II secretion system protein [Mycobacteriales bacterium]
MRRQRRRTVTDDGFTLTELLVSMAIFSIVSGMVTTAAVTGLHKQTEVANRDDALAQMRTALQRIDREIRSTYPLLSASSTQLVLREVESTVTRTVTFQVTGSTLTWGETDTDANGSTTTIPARTLLTNLVDTATSPVFSFAPLTGYTAPSGSGVDASTCALGNGIDAGCVGTITVRLTVRPPYLASALTMTDSGTDLRNAA